MLTPKQEKFCNLYVLLGNASEAYRGAYSCGNMKAESIHRLAKELMDNIKITSRIKELQAELQARSDMEKDEAVSVLANIIRLNPLDYLEIGSDSTVSIDDSGTISKSEKQTVVVKDLSALTVDQQKCIKSITPTKFGLKIEFESKINAIGCMSKMKGWDSVIKTEETKKVIVQVRDENIKEEIDKL